MRDKVLYVDDDPNILAACARSLGRVFDLTTAISGAEGLERLSTAGPFAVVLSDMRMPGMNGIEFLHEAQRLAPDTVRLMLTGNSDQQTAIDAVNRGQIFRFLTKPCEPDTLKAALDAGVRQHHLLTAEKELLSKTLLGSVRALADALSLVHPMAFARAGRIKPIVRVLVQELKPDHAWQFELAAALCQIGCVVLPPGIIEKVHSGGTLTDKEADLYASHPACGRRLLDHIPRLGVCAQIIEGQLSRFEDAPRHAPDPSDAAVALGAQILHAALDLEALIAEGVVKHTALTRLREREGEYNPDLLDLLDRLTLPGIDDAANRVAMELSLWKLKPGMIADDAILTSTGTLLAPKGVEITTAIIQKLRNFANGAGIKEPIRVLVSMPPGSASDPRTHPESEAA